MAKDKGQEVSDDIKNKLTEYVYSNYKTYTNKTLVIRDKGTHYTVLKHIHGGPLYLSKDVV
tara:strand:- start:146 stop:328 length:183 start_codon:yes stop_codon:yes gene_type:complete